MERIELYCGGRAAGEITLESVGSQIEVRGAMAAPGDGLYRAALLGERGELPLGVMEPGGGQLTLRRRLYRRDVATLGPLLRGEARRSFAFSEQRLWRRTARPGDLFQSRWLRERLADCGTALWRREGERLCVALPYAPARPFPLETLFCLARLERIDGKRWVVYSFDRAEKPLIWEKKGKISESATISPPYVV